MKQRGPLILLPQAGRSDLAGTLAGWKAFVRGEAPGPLVRPHVLRAWIRSRDGGCDPHRMRADMLDPTSRATLLAAESDLITTTGPFMAALSRAAGTDPHAAMLGDRNGRVLAVQGDEPSVAAVPAPGSLLDEASAGANGIGTSLAEDAYVELIGPEHYIEGFHPFTCTGIPLRGAMGETLGVLSISVRRQRTADRLRDIVFCAAQAVECERLSRWLADAVLAAARESVPAIAEVMRRDLLQQLSAMRLHLEQAALSAALTGERALVDRAESLIRGYQRLAETWRDLVRDEGSPPSRFRLLDVVEDLAALLSAEFALAGIDVSWGPTHAGFVLEDRGAVARALLGCFLTAMQQAGPGGGLRIESGPVDGAGEVEVRIQILDRPGLAEPQRFRARASLG